MDIERRRAKRIKKQLMVQYQELDSPEHWDMTEIKDFSEVGIAIISHKEYEINKIFRFRLKLPSNPLHSQDIETRVVSCDKNVMGAFADSRFTSFIVRLEISKIEPEAKEMIKQYVKWFLDKAGS